AAGGQPARDAGRKEAAPGVEAEAERGEKGGGCLQARNLAVRKCGWQKGVQERGTGADRAAEQLAPDTIDQGAGESPQQRRQGPRRTVAVVPQRAQAQDVLGDGRMLEIPAPHAGPEVQVNEVLEIITA